MYASQIKASALQLGIDIKGFDLRRNSDRVSLLKLISTKRHEETITPPDCEFSGQECTGDTCAVAESPLSPENLVTPTFRYLDSCYNVCTIYQRLELEGLAVYSYVANEDGRLTSWYERTLEVPEGANIQDVWQEAKDDFIKSRKAQDDRANALICALNSASSYPVTPEVAQDISEAAKVTSYDDSGTPETPWKSHSTVLVLLITSLVILWSAVSCLMKPLVVWVIAKGGRFINELRLAEYTKRLFRKLEGLF
ncbi:MAG: hypothetical protein KME59_21495 [Trichormus sp. ATA11-4-KO1]|jgi:hypothetical protein|nr:hypothetical protein [Trichormus sp. ATA11-4-KO1]